MDYTLITGATGVLGGVFAEQCLRRGENLFLTGRSEDKLTALRVRLLALFPSARIEFCACDLSDERSRARLYECAGSFSFSRLINVAGVDTQKAFALYDERKLTFQIRTDFEGAASLMLFCINHRAKSLRIINISSLCGEYDIPYFALYSSAKGALTSLTLSLAGEFGREVNFTAVLPGAIHTRKDVEEYIKRQGLWGKIAAKTPEYVATKSLLASDKGKKFFIPGAANRAAYRLSRLLPRGLLSRLNGRMRKGMTKDAFM